MKEEVTPKLTPVSTTIVWMYLIKIRIIKLDDLIGNFFISPL